MKRSVEKKEKIALEDLTNNIDENIVATLNTADNLIKPVRQSVLKRFPVLFLLLVTFGVVCVLYSFEVILSRIDFLYQRPWLILIVGVATLAMTGRLYKKLD